MSNAVGWVEDGTVITSAGVSAGIDLALHLVGRLAGEEVARQVQLIMEYDPLVNQWIAEGSISAATARQKSSLQRSWIPASPHARTDNDPARCARLEGSWAGPGLLS